MNVRSQTASRPPTHLTPTTQNTLSAVDTSNLHLFPEFAPVEESRAALPSRDPSILLLLLLHPHQSVLHPTKASPSCCSAATKGIHSTLSNLPKWEANNGVVRSVVTRKRPSARGFGPPLATAHHRGIVHNNAYCGSRSLPRVSSTPTKADRVKR